MDKHIDITPFLSDQLCAILATAGAKARDMKHEQIDEDHILWALTTFDSQVQYTLNTLAQLTSTITFVTNELQQKKAWSQAPEKIVLKNTVRKSLLEAFMQAYTLKEKQITPLAFLITLAKNKLTPFGYDGLAKTLNLERTFQESFLQKDDALKTLTQSEETANTYIDRPEYIEQIIRLLFKDTQKHIFLVGNDGIGKRSTKYLLQKRAEQPGNILTGANLFTLDIGKVKTQQIQEELLQILGKIKNVNGTKYIVYIENLDVNASDIFRDTSSLTTIFEKLQQAGCNTITPVNYVQYQAMLKGYPNIMKVSEVLIMEEANTDTILKMLEAHYKTSKVQIPSPVLQETISLVKRYQHETFLPESALSLLDEATSQARIDNTQTLDANSIKKILAQKTGIPLEDISDKEAADLQNLEGLLMQSVIGQDDALQAVVKTIKRSRAGLKDPKRPIGSFLFLGPSGTGKTQLAKAIAKAVYKDESAMIRLDMSEYTDAHTVDRLIGAPPGYVGYEEGGQLTNKVLKKPYSLILLDEVEKANPKVFDVFLQVLDDGRLTDGQGKTVDFKNTIIIMTSNIVNQEKLTAFFRPEFLNRIDQIIAFKPLSIESGKAIVKLFIQELIERLREKRIYLDVTEDVITQIATQGISPTYGARPLKRLVEEKIEDPIVEKLISGDIKEGDTITWNQL